MPKPLYHKQLLEVEFYQSVFDVAEVIPWRIGDLHLARDLAQMHGIAAMDAIHVAMAISACADELISAERPEKPLFRMTELAMRSIRQEGTENDH